MAKRSLILASASPRRKEILKNAGYDFKVVPSNADEAESSRSPDELVISNALLKARDVASKEESRGAIVLGADTVVCINGEILGKPRDACDARRMLKTLSGKTHRVLTGYAVISPDGKEKTGLCATHVKFKTLDDREIDAYIATGEPLDKAGAYGIQERGSAFVESIDGDFLNVVGLPIDEIKPLLGEIGT